MSKKHHHKAPAPKAAPAAQGPLRTVFYTPIRKDGVLVQVLFNEQLHPDSNSWAVANALGFLAEPGTLSARYRGDTLTNLEEKVLLPNGDRGWKGLWPVTDAYAEAGEPFPDQAEEVLEFGERRLLAFKRKQATAKAAQVETGHAFRALVDRGV